MIFGGGVLGKTAGGAAFDDGEPEGLGVGASQEFNCDTSEGSHGGRGTAHGKMGPKW